MTVALEARGRPLAPALVVSLSEPLRDTVARLAVGRPAGHPGMCRKACIDSALAQKGE